MVAALVIGIPVACTTLASMGGGEESHEVSERTAAVNDFPWPLTVPEGRIFCPGAGQLVFERDGTRYALNGLAKGADYADIDPIWRDDPEIDGLKVDIGGLIAYGNVACGY